LSGGVSLEAEDQGDAVQCLTTTAIRRSTDMKIKSNVKAGGMGTQHNQTMTRGLKVKTSVKAGGQGAQRNQTVTRGLKVKTNVKAGIIAI